MLTLPLIPCNIVKNVFSELRIKRWYVYKQINIWNYNQETHNTNNVCEAYKSLNSYFNSKPIILKLINILTIEEEELFKDYSKIVCEGFISKKRRLGPSDYICCLPYFIDKEKELKCSNAWIRKKD